MNDLAVLKHEIDKLRRDVDRLYLERAYERERNALLEKKFTKPCKPTRSPQWTLDDELRLTLLELPFPSVVATIIVNYNDTLHAGRQKNDTITVGDICDVLDTDKRWLHAEVLAWRVLPPVVMFGSRTMLDRQHVQIRVHYIGWSQTWDEWILLSSPRVAPYGSKVPVNVITPRDTYIE